MKMYVGVIILNPNNKFFVQTNDELPGDFLLHGESPGECIEQSLEMREGEFNKY